MGRLGIAPDDAFAAVGAIANRCTLAGVWTHFADAGGPAGHAQLERFTALVDALRGEGIDVRAHAANSAALLALPDSTFDMVRIGTLLYGQDPPGARAPWPHAATFAWCARVVAVRDVPAGATVGYGSEWRAPRDARLATIPVGYADGFGVEPHARTPGPREAARAVLGALRGGERSVRFDEGDAPVVGRVAMQAITVDVTGLPSVRAGSVARLPARRLMVSAAIERVYA